MANLSIRSVRPEDLKERDIEGIHEVMQDMWASEAGLGELAQCTDCKKMISKEEAFCNLPPELANDTVAHVFRVIGTDEVPCPACGGKTRLIYGSGNIGKIRQRLLESMDSFVVLCVDQEKGIVGFEEGYVDSLERIFELDFTDHYGGVGLPEIRKRIQGILGHVPDRMILLSSLGLLKDYRNFQNMFKILNRFAEILPERHDGMPGLTEMHRWGVTHRMSEGINHGVSLWIEDTPELRKKMTAVGEKYDSNLVLYPNPIGMYRDNFTKGIKHLMKTIRGSGHSTQSSENGGILAAT